MNIAKFSVSRPVAVTMRIASMVLLGVICLTRLPVDLLPKVSLPTVAINTTWPNVAPEEIETQVTRPIEQAVAAAPNVYQVSSTTSAGSSSVRIQFQWGVDVDQAAVDVLQLVERAKSRFPTDPTLQTPAVFKFDPSQLPILVYGISGIDDPVKLRTLLDNEVSPLIESADGVASAQISGGLQRSIMIDLDKERLRAHSLTADDVIKRIDAENVNEPAGIARESDTEYTIRSLGLFTSPEQIGRIPVGSFGGQLVPLSAVANVRDASSEIRLYTRLNGEPAVGLIVSKQSDANTVAAAESVREKIKEVEKLYPQLKFGLAYDQSQFIEHAITEVKNSALIGGALAILILLFFLRNFRSTLVVALSIPISVFSTFALMYMCGFTLNTMSLGGLALATGLIVDDAVVVLENIFRHIERDKRTPHDAAITASSEIMSAVVASTFTIMIVFLPLLLIKGQAGQMFTQFALVVIFSMAVSLLDATTVVPMLASRLITGEAHAEADVKARGIGGWFNRRFAKWGEWFDALDASYRRGLTWALHHRFWIVGGGIAVTAASFLIVPFVGSEIMPQTDSGDLSINVKLPVGTALERTNTAMKDIERIVMENKNVETAFSAAGSTLGFRGNTTSLRPYQGSVTVKLKEERKNSTFEVIGQLRKALRQVSGANARISQTDIVTNILTGGSQNLEAVIYGNDLTTLTKLGKQAMDAVKEVPGLESVDVNWEESNPELQWKVDREKALQLGLSFSDISAALNTATNGTIASYYQESGFQYPIIVQLPENTRKTVNDLKNLAITPSGSGGVPGTAAANGNPPRVVLLGQVATPVIDTGPSQITRQNRQRYIAVTGQPQGRAMSEIQTDVQQAMDKLEMPSGYRWTWGTNMKRQQEEFGGMWVAVLLAIALIYMLLASQFESFIHPLTILFSVPLSSIGVVLALFLSGRAFGLTAFVGLLLLVGIVVKNGILLIDYTNLLRSQGKNREEAVLTAGPTRLRPILMTTCAAVFGMLPLAIGIGKGSETQAPMATAVIGGLITSTLLTLFVVPTVYTIFDDLSLWFRRGRPQVAYTGGHDGAATTPDVQVVPAEKAILRDSVPLNGHANGSHGHTSDEEAEQHKH